MDLGAADARAPDTGAEMERVDWAATPLGPRATWSPGLRQAVRIVLGSRFSMWMGWGPEQTFIYNDAYARDTLAAKHPWALGRPVREVWAEIWDDIGPRIDHVLATGDATWDEGLLLYLERSGYREETYHTFSYSPLHDDAGVAVGILCVVVEETDRVLGERRLATLGELATALTSATGEDDVHACVRACLGANPRDVPFALTYLAEADGAARLRNRTGNVPGPPRLTHAEAEARWGTRGEALVIPLADAGSEAPLGFLVAGLNPDRALDDAYRRFLELVAGQIAAGVASARAREADRERASALAELDRAKTHFFQNVSHELRTPLSLILSPAQDALEDAEDPEQRRRVEVILRNALRLQKLVNNLLDFSRLESGRADPLRTPTDLGTFTADLASMFRAACERAGLTLAVDVPDAPVIAAVDREMWERIVLNLVSNAFKFTFDGGIAVRLVREGDTAVLTVSDTGTGIAPDELEQLFERFRRVRGARSRTHEGSGIGLALVQELAHLHNGTVAAESAPGAGTTFTVRLPLTEADVAASAAAPTGGATAYVEEALRWLPDAGQAIESEDVVGAGLPAPAPTHGPRARVLLADDNADLREYLERLLSGTYDVEAVGDGRAALDAVARRRPDLIVSDAMMPELDGFGLLAALRADPGTAQVPVIMLSARAGEEAAVEGLAAGADDYLVKPFSSRELLARVRATLDLADLRQAAARATERHAQLLRDLADAAVAIGGAETTGAVLETTAARARALIGTPWSLMRIEHDAGAEERTSGDATGADLHRALRVPIHGRDFDGVLLLPADTGVTGAEAEAVLSQLAQVAATRLESALLYEREHQVAVTLQRSLLPDSLPGLPDAQLAALYLPGSTDVAVGGDWYDAFAVDERRTALVMGDVVGRGVRAAALMGQLRNAVRAYVHEGYGPAETLGRVNRLLELQGGGFATLCCVMLELETGAVTYARAGHPPPLVIEPDGRTRWLDAGLAPPLGARPHLEAFREATDHVGGGSALVLYTDGLVERRGEVLDVGFDRLAVTASDCPGDATLLASRLVAAMPGTDRPDDVAVLALARRGGPGEPFVARLPAEPGSLAALRAGLRRWMAREGITGDAAGDLLLVAGEAAANAVEHPLAPAPPAFVVSVRREPDGRTVVRVRDHGRWREPAQTTHRGRGLPIIRTVAGEVEVERTPEGTTTTVSGDFGATP